MTYLCPLCQAPLSQESNTLRCENRHQFDIAKEGYVNLLPVQHKRSKEPGDSKEMMQARRAFLEGNHYHPMREGVADVLKANLPESEAMLLDIGCGEGFYTHYFADQLSDATVYGMDISKTAIRYASKRYANCRFSVASIQRLPFPDASLDGVVRIYAPCNGEELNRVVKENGILVTVTPAGRHLYQLKGLIYDEVRLHDIPPETLPGFTLESEQNLHYPMKLTGQQAEWLLQMTPFAWRASETVWETVRNAGVFDCEADFTLRIYRKR